MTIYDVQNAQKLPIWKQRIIECRSSGIYAVKHGLQLAA